MARIYHPGLKRHVEVPESTAAALCDGESGWKPAPLDQPPVIDAPAKASRVEQ